MAIQSRNRKRQAGQISPAVPDRGEPELTDPNLEIAALLLDLSEVYRPSPRFWGYKNASRSIRRHPEFLSELADTDILKIEGVGPASLRVVREYLDTGESPTVSRHRGGQRKVEGD